MQPLAGQAAVVTGSGRNIGRAIALMLAADGAGVVVNGRHDSDAVDAVVVEIEAAGGRAAACMTDASSQDGAKALVAAASAAFGRLDILVLNHATRRQGPFLEIPFSEWRKVMEQDLDGPFHCMQAAIPMMQVNGQGRIVTLGGSTTHGATPNRAHVKAAKMGLLGLMRAVAVEFAGDGITANCVAPGHADTSRGEASGDRSSGGPGRLIERMGHVDEIAAMVRHLCRPEGAYITGQIIHVDGGMYFGGA